MDDGTVNRLVTLSSRRFPPRSLRPSPPETPSARLTPHYRGGFGPLFVRPSRLRRVWLGGKEDDRREAERSDTRRLLRRFSVLTLTSHLSRLIPLLLTAFASASFTSRSRM